MPAYPYECPKCQTQFERTLSLSDRNEPQTCPGEACDGVGKKMLGSPSFVLAGDGWTGKNIKIKGQMDRKNRRLDAKARDLPNQRLVPNVNGEETDTWAEAKKFAASEGKDTTGYDAFIRKEKAA